MSKILDFFKNHKLRSVIILIVILAVGYYWYGKTHAAVGKTQYLTEAAAKNTITVTVNGTGQVAASNQMDIKPQSDGRLTSVNIKQNQAIKAGDVLAIVDQQSAANSVAQARANLEQAQASYDKLMAGATQNDIQSQQLSIQSAQSSLDQAKRDYNTTIIQQEQDVAKASSTLFNTGLLAQPNDNNSTAGITVTGNYTGSQQGSYNIILYLSGSGMNYSVSGLGTASGMLTRGIALPIGSGLFITFDTTGTLSQSSTWTINVPNINSSSYAGNLNAYNAALLNQQQAISQAQDAIDSAQNALDKANLSLATTTQPPTDSDVASAKAQITSAQAQLANAQTAYDATILRAPFDGVVAAVDYSVGDKITAGTTIATVITKQQIAKISLNEVDVSKIKLGNPATLTFDAIDGLDMTGKVAQIDTIGTVSQGVVTYNVQILLDTQDDRVKPGMSVSVDIITDVKPDVLTVPNSAIKTNGNQSYVQILDSQGKPQNVNVQTGVANDTLTEITSGLTEGQQVVTQTITTGITATTGTAAASGLRLPGLGGGGAVRGATIIGR